MSDKTTSTPFLSNKVFDVLKWVAQIFLPAVGALYFGLSDIWDLPKATEVVGTITVIDTFLGALLAFSTANYNNSDAKFDGSIDVEQVSPDKKVFSLNLDALPEELELMDQVTFKVNKPV